MKTQNAKYLFDDENILFSHFVDSFLPHHDQHSQTLSN